MIIPMLGDQIDERFLMHRLKSTSIAGVVGGLLASGLFVYQFFASGVARWDLLAVAVTSDSRRPLSAGRRLLGGDDPTSAHPSSKIEQEARCQ
ncbi:MAG: hypothetical protein AMS25_12685 [Gemmatimonas sp. SM23_52]|nr:MAG: hypothetical protein AMS25_12685 [Gemmatimonas sp. SM23_52]